MKKFFMCCALMAAVSGRAMAQYQIGNSDFETDWTDVNEPGNGWYSFVSGTGDMASLGIMFSKGNTTKVDGRNGGSAVQIKSSSILGKKANGNLTTGQINLGSTEPSDHSNYNFTNRSGKNHSTFSGHPDKVEYWAKFKRGGSANNGRCHLILHGDINYQDPYESSENEEKYKIAEATVYATPCTEWTKFEGEFEYTGIESDKSYMLATFTTNETPGGSSGDVFIIDDIKFIYYSELASGTFNGTPLTINADGTIEDVKDIYSEDKISLTSNGHGATIEKSYDEETTILTVTVKGEDISENASNFHTYTIQFAKKGDVNGDGEVTIADVTALVNIILEKDEKKAIADVNGDDDVTIADVTALVNIILGK